MYVNTTLYQHSAYNQIYYTKFRYNKIDNTFDVTRFIRSKHYCVHNFSFKSDPKLILP